MSVAGPGPRVPGQRSGNGTPEYEFGLSSATLIARHGMVKLARVGLLPIPILPALRFRRSNLRLEAGAR
jgi:hypothetical protein